MKTIIKILLIVTLIVGLTPYIIYVRYIREFQPVTISKLAVDKIAPSWNSLCLQNYQLGIPVRDRGYIVVPYLDMLYPVNKSMGVKILSQDRQDILTVTFGNIHQLDVKMDNHKYSLLDMIRPIREWMLELGTEKLLYKVFREEITYYNSLAPIKEKFFTFLDIVSSNNYMDLINNIYTLSIRAKVVPSTYKRIEFLEDDSRNIAIFGDDTQEIWNIFKGSSIYTLNVAFVENNHPKVVDIKKNMLSVLNFLDDPEVSRMLDIQKINYEQLTPAEKKGQAGISYTYSSWSMRPSETNASAKKIALYLKTNRLLARSNYWFYIEPSFNVRGVSGSR